MAISIISGHVSSQVFISVEVCSCNLAVTRSCSTSTTSRYNSSKQCYYSTCNIQAYSKYIVTHSTAGDNLRALDNTAQLLVAEHKAFDRWNRHSQHWSCSYPGMWLKRCDGHLGAWFWYFNFKLDEWKLNDWNSNTMISDISAFSKKWKFLRF